MISDSLAERYASLLLNAEAKRMPIDPFSATDPAFSPGDAYRIQDRIVSEHIRRGEMPIGYKIGVTTKPIQKLFGSDVLGNPADSVAWLANKLGSRGLALRKGMVILSGSLVGMHPASSGDRFRFDYDCFGSVSVRFA